MLQLSDLASSAAEGSTACSACTFINSADSSCCEVNIWLIYAHQHLSCGSIAAVYCDTVVVSSCFSCDTNCITNSKLQVECVVWLQMCGGSLEPQAERLHPKHKNTLSKINQLMGGRGKHDEQRAAKVSDGQWRDAVSQLQVFVRVGGPVSGNRQHHEVGQAVFCTLQRALQSGPLGGGKPGHFGRKVSPGKTPSSPPFPNAQSAASYTRTCVYFYVYVSISVFGLRCLHCLCICGQLSSRCVEGVE